MLKTKLIYCLDPKYFERDTNEFLDNRHIVVVDVKYSHGVKHGGEVFTAFILYRDRVDADGNEGL